MRIQDHVLEEVAKRKKKIYKLITHLDTIKFLLEGLENDTQFITQSEVVAKNLTTPLQAANYIIRDYVGIQTEGNEDFLKLLDDIDKL